MIDKKLYKEAFSHLRASPDTRRKIMNMTNDKKRTPRRAVRTALIAAVLAVALVTTAFAALSGVTLQSWFARQWNEETGKDLTAEQICVMNALTQKVDQSITVNGVTVTADSLAVGYDCVWVLFRVEWDGYSPDYKYDLGLGGYITPSSPGGGYSGGRYEWDDGSETLCFLVKYATSAHNRDMLSYTDGGYTLNVPACGLYRYKENDMENKELVELGSWEFSIPLTEKSVSPAVELGDIQIEVADKNYAEGYGGVQRFEPGTYSLQDVIVTCSSVSYYYDEMFQKKDSSSGITAWLPDAVAVLADGTEIAGSTGGIWDFEESRYLLNSWWPLPLSVDEIVSIRIGETVIPVNNS